MGDDTKKPDAGAKPDDKWLGEEDGKVNPNVEGSRGYATPSHEVKKGVGNREVSDEERAATKKSKVSTEVGIKPIYSKTLYDNTAKKGPLNTRENKDDATYQSAMTAKVTLEAGGATLDVAEKKAKLTAVNLKAEGAVYHAQGDFGTWLHDLFFDPIPEVKKTPPNPPSPAPMAARVGDMTTHGSPLAPGTGSPNVMIGGLPAWRIGGDQHACAMANPAPHGPGPTVLLAPHNVFINGFPAARAGDFVTEATGGPNAIVLGCPTVMIGPKAGAAPEATQPEPRPEDLPWVKFESVPTFDVVGGEASAKVEAEGDLKKRKGKAEAIVGGEVAALKAEIPLKLRIRIPGTTYYLGLGVTGSGKVLAVGAEAGVGVKINDGKTLFEGTAGASASIGPGGLGAKFSLDVSK